MISVPRAVGPERLRQRTGCLWPALRGEWPREIMVLRGGDTGSRREECSELIQQRGGAGKVPSPRQEVLWCSIPHIKVTAVDVLIRLREMSPAEQCRAMHNCARARAQGELDTRSRATAAAAAATIAAVVAAAVAAAASKAESPQKWT